MKKMSAVVLFFCCNAFLVFFEVHKQGRYLTLSYDVQKLQAEICNLKKEHSELLYALHALQQPDMIKEIAQKELGMKPVELKNIRPMPHELVEESKELHHAH